MKLPRKLKAGVEQLSGVPLDQVRVRKNSSRPPQLDAQAYAQGSAIHLAPGQEQHLPHAAWQVVQQKQGRVKRTRQLAGKPIDEAPALEKAANRAGAAALRTAPRKRGSRK